MSTIKNLITTWIMYLVSGILSVIGMLAGFTIWNNGLGDKVEEKTKAFFKR